MRIRQAMWQSSSLTTSGVAWEISLKGRESTISGVFGFFNRALNGRLGCR